MQDATEERVSLKFLIVNPFSRAARTGDETARRLSRPQAGAFPSRLTPECEMTKHLARSRSQLTDRQKQKNILGGIQNH